jgi:hypothetical protein
MKTNIIYNNKTETGEIKYPCFFKMRGEGRDVIIFAQSQNQGVVLHSNMRQIFDVGMEFHTPDKFNEQAWELFEGILEIKNSE